EALDRIVLGFLQCQLGRLDLGDAFGRGFFDELLAADGFRLARGLQAGDRAKGRGGCGQQGQWFQWVHVRSSRDVSSQGQKGKALVKFRTNLRQRNRDTTSETAQPPGCKRKNSGRTEPRLTSSKNNP